ncbi:MAG: Trm112 family protein [Candidatus Nanopelagicales bacterium]
MSGQLDPLLREVLVCPQPHHTRLGIETAQLRCPTCGAVYPIAEGGIPVLLPLGGEGRDE